MNKDKEWLRDELMKFKESTWGRCEDVIGVSHVLRVIDQLEEPAKVVIPQFVADEIELHKLDKDPLVSAFENVNLDDWLYGNMARNVDVFARAWLDGYVIEKEPLYIISIPKTDDVLACLKNEDDFEFTSEASIVGNSAWKYTFTESEIKSIDERFWPFALEVES